MGAPADFSWIDVGIAHVQIDPAARWSPSRVRLTTSALQALSELQGQISITKRTTISSPYHSGWTEESVSIAGPEHDEDPARAHMNGLLATDICREAPIMWWADLNKMLKDIGADPFTNKKDPIAAVLRKRMLTREELSRMITARQNKIGARSTKQTDPRRAILNWVGAEPSKRELPAWRYAQIIAAVVLAASPACDPKDMVRIDRLACDLRDRFLPDARILSVR